MKQYTNIELAVRDALSYNRRDLVDRVNNAKDILSLMCATSEIASLKHNFDHLPLCRPKSFDKFFLPNDLNIISEIKLASPVVGRIADEVSEDKEGVVVTTARRYFDAGFRCFSVLCEEYGFLGNINYIRLIRQNPLYEDVFILQKDFVSTPKQVLDGLKCGADTFLIIVAMLSAWQFMTLLDMAREYNIVPLIEVHTQEEFEVVLSLADKYPETIKVVGFNNRDLKSGVVDVKNSYAFASQTGRHPQFKFISESGLKLGDLDDLRKVGYAGFLIGTSIVNAKNGRF